MSSRPSEVEALMAEWPGLRERMPTGGDAPPMARAHLILHADAAIVLATRRRDELLAEANSAKVPTRALGKLLGVGFNTIARRIRAAGPTDKEKQDG